MLQATDNRQLKWDVVQTALELEFPPEEAERQLDAAVTWGRYAELLSYEDNTQLIYLEIPAHTLPRPNQNG